MEIPHEEDSFTIFLKNSLWKFCGKAQFLHETNIRFQKFPVVIKVKCSKQKNKIITIAQQKNISKMNSIYIITKKLLNGKYFKECKVERHSFPIVSDELPETMRKLCLSTKFPHQEIR